MDYTQPLVSPWNGPSRSYEQLVCALDLLIEEEKRLDLRSRVPKSPSHIQASKDLAVNHARTAEVLATLWRVQAGE